MRKLYVFIVLFLSLTMSAVASDSLAVRGLCIPAPSRHGVDRFVRFIQQELTPRHANTLVLMINYNYQFKSHPELSDSGALSKQDVEKIVKACMAGHIKLIPSIDLLGHQSWAAHTDKLLSVYPQFDETPWVKMPASYKWPNQDKLYCKSYCPLYPGVHKVIFDLIDELCNVFQSDVLHAGMDEVFYIGEDQCPRCGGRDKSVLFADEVNRIDDHLASKGRHLWIWGDRLIDGKTTGIGEWEASMNQTYRAVDLIHKDVTICDWHYENACPTPVYFAMKGLNVITCCWRKPAVAVTQARDMVHFGASSPKDMKSRYQGMMQTVWSGADAFLNQFYSTEPAGKESAAACFKALFDQLQQP
jgi:hypothetical protein